MKTYSVTLLILFFTLLSMTAKAQHGNIDSLSCKEWKFLAYEEGGMKVTARKEQEKDRMIFYADHKVKSCWRRSL